MLEFSVKTYIVYFQRFLGKVNILIEQGDIKMNSVKSTCIRINLQNYLDKPVQSHSGNYPSVNRAEHPGKYGSSSTLL